MAWLLDTNVLVNAKRDHYGFEFCPGFWDWLDVAFAAGHVASVEAVYDELVDYGDQLSDWARDHRAFFRVPGAAEVGAMATVNGWAAAASDYTLAAKQGSPPQRTRCSLRMRWQEGTPSSPTSFRQTRPSASRSRTLRRRSECPTRRRGGCSERNVLCSCWGRCPSPRDAAYGADIGERSRRSHG